MHTSNGTYQHALAEHGCAGAQAAALRKCPGCGTPTPRRGWRRSSRARAATRCRPPGRREDWWVFAIFGTLHPVWPPQPLLDELQAAAAAAGKRVALISAGRLGAGESIWTGMPAAYGSRVPMLRLGEQPAPRISELLQYASTSASRRRRWRSSARARRWRRCSITGCRSWSTATTAAWPAPVGRRRARSRAGDPDGPGSGGALA